MREGREQRGVRRVSFRLIALGVAFMGFVAAGGCAEDGSGGLFGYHATELFPQDVRTVSVRMFESRTFYRAVEIELTEALSKEIETRTPYKVVSGDSSSDTVLTGTITRVNERVLSRSRDAGGVPQEMQVVVAATFEWKDLRTGAVLRRRGPIQGTGEFVPTYPMGEPFEVGRHQAVAELSREIVSVMREDW